MNKPEGVGNSLVAVDGMADSFKPDVQIMIKMSVLSSLLPQLFLLQQHQQILNVYH